MYYKKAVLKSFEHFTEKILMHEPLEIKLQAYSLKLLLEKGTCTGVFLENLPNILKHLFFAKHVLVTASVKYLFARQPQSPNVTIELVFCLLPTTIVRANISFF